MECAAAVLENTINKSDLLPFKCDWQCTHCFASGLNIQDFFCNANVLLSQLQRKQQTIRGVAVLVLICIGVRIGTTLPFLHFLS